MLALEPEAAEVERGLAVLGQLIRPAGVFRDIHADGADSAGEPHRLDQVVQRGGIVFMASRVVGLVAHALGATVGAQAVGVLHDLVDW